VSTSARRCEVTSPDFTVPVRSVTRDELQALETWADVIVVQGFLLALSVRLT
jgi:hypothetical protein